ncbi:MAG: DNA repair protein RadC [Oscillospiraceae bacterium]|nr:DNA repair protein RadC [Oscillospiraceae bacterium]
MGLHDGHRARMKQKYLEQGPEGFADHELLELALFYAIPRRNTNETAHRLLGRFGSLKNILTADAQALREVPGVGENAAVLLMLLRAVGARADRPAPPKTPVHSGDQVGGYFLRLLDGEKKEVLYLMCLDAKGKLLSCQTVAEGGVNVTAVSVRQVVDLALRSNATSVVLAHNHPSGVALPSQADQFMTRQVADALRPLGIRLLDHIVVADGDYVSMAQSGMDLS